MKHRQHKICFAASSGGHLEELLVLRPLMEGRDSFIVTEKAAFGGTAGSLRHYELLQVNRREKTWVLRMAVNVFLSLKIYLAERPDMIVCTGVLATIPLCLLCKLFGKKLVYIESYAKVKTPNLTGRLLYPFADRFYIQWPKLQEAYPKAVYVGGIY